MNTTLTRNDTSESPVVAPRQATRPKTDIYETEEAWLLVLDLPGADENGTDISIEKQVLTITADVETSVPEGFERVHTEFPPRHYERSFRLPEEVDTSQIEAIVKNGVLRLSLPKSTAARPHHITVKAG